MTDSPAPYQGNPLLAGVYLLAAIGGSALFQNELPPEQVRGIVGTILENLPGGSQAVSDHVADRFHAVLRGETIEGPHQ